MDSLTQSSTQLLLDHYQYLQQLASLHLLHVHRKVGSALFNSPSPLVSLVCITFSFFFHLSHFLLQLWSHKKQDLKRPPSSPLCPKIRSNIWDCISSLLEVFFCFINKTFFFPATYLQNWITTYSFLGDKKQCHSFQEWITTIAFNYRAWHIATLSFQKYF